MRTYIDGRGRAPDKLIGLLKQPLSDEQRLYIDQHKHIMRRTKLAARVGISKLQLNHYLDGGGDAS